MAKVDITNAEVDPGSPITTALMTALRDNADVDIQEFSTSGTWTKPTACAGVLVLLWGGGGSGGSSDTGLTGSNAGGGSGGAFSTAYLDEAHLSASESVTVGAGAPPNAVGALSAGTDGGDTTFADVTAGGGQGGGYSPTGTAGAQSGGVADTFGGRDGGASTSINGPATTQAADTYWSGAAGGNASSEATRDTTLGASSVKGGDGGDGGNEAAGGAGAVRGGGGGATNDRDNFASGPGGDGYAIIISF